MPWVKHKSILGIPCDLLVTLRAYVSNICYALYCLSIAISRVVHLLVEFISFGQEAHVVIHVHLLLWVGPPMCLTKY